MEREGRKRRERGVCLLNTVETKREREKRRSSFFLNPAAHSIGLDLSMHAGGVNSAKLKLCSSINPRKKGWCLAGEKQLIRSRSHRPLHPCKTHSALKSPPLSLHRPPHLYPLHNTPSYTFFARRGGTTRGLHGYFSFFLFFSKNFSPSKGSKVAEVNRCKSFDSLRLEDERYYVRFM